jgi:CBS domain-containing protein
MTAALFMNPRPVVLRTDETIAQGALAIMAKQRRSLPVVDEDGRFQGMLTANCLLYLCLPTAATIAGGLDSMRYVEDSLEDVAERLKQYLDEPIARCLKTEKVAVVHPDTPIVETLLTLYRNKTNLPVVERNSGILVGTISYYNVGAKIMEAVNAKTG